MHSIEGLLLPLVNSTRSYIKAEDTGDYIEMMKKVHKIDFLEFLEVNSKEQARPKRNWSSSYSYILKNLDCLSLTQHFTMPYYNFRKLRKFQLLANRKIL